MRKFRAVLITLAILAVCTPSYGVIVTYKMDMPVRAVDSDTNNTLIKVNAKAFLVMDITETEEGVFDVDANLIIYGKEPDKDKVFAVLSTNDGNDFLNIDVWEEGEIFVVDFWSDNCNFNFEGIMLGKEKTAKFNLGLQADNDIAFSMNGVIEIWEGMLFSTAQDLTGTGTISATLDRPHTASTDPEEGTTLEAVTNDLIEDFLGKFTNANPPPCED
jgi:hypothetical protein